MRSSVVWVVATHSSMRAVQYSALYLRIICSTSLCMQTALCLGENATSPWLDKQPGFFRLASGREGGIHVLDAVRRLDHQAREEADDGLDEW